MAFISPFLSGTSFFSAATTIVSSPIKDFFLQLFLNPGGNTYAVYIICGVTVAACIGLAFLIQKVYEKYCPERKF